MVSTVPHPPNFGFTTEGLPVADGLAGWRDSFGRLIRLDMEPLGDKPFQAQAEMCALRDVTFASMASTPLRATRTPELARDGRDDIGLLVLLSGTAEVSQAGRNLTLTRGDGVFLRNGEPGSVSFPRAVRYFNLGISRSVLPHSARHLTSALPVVLRDSEQALRLLVGYARLLQRTADTASGAALQLAASHIHDLVALLAGAHGDEAEHARNGGLRAARLNAIKSDITENFGRHDLSVNAVAARQGISPRYLRKLFESEGTSFSEFVRNFRLTRAKRMLTDPRFAHHSISAIAFDVGFADLSYFNRCFRQRYGEPPSAMRG